MDKYINNSYFNDNVYDVMMINVLKATGHYIIKGGLLIDKNIIDKVCSDFVQKMIDDGYKMHCSCNYRVSMSKDGFIGDILYYLDGGHKLNVLEEHDEYDVLEGVNGELWINHYFIFKKLGG